MADTPTSNLTHFDADGRPRMVDISGKSPTHRTASAEGWVNFSKTAYAQISNGSVEKGDVIAIAELAGVMGAKRTADLVPLCHPLPLTGVKVRIEKIDDRMALRVLADVKTNGKTGVEMEALTAVSTACLTIYDMAKAIDKTITIDAIRLLEKTGGKSGDFKADSEFK